MELRNGVLGLSVLSAALLFESGALAQETVEQTSELSTSTTAAPVDAAAPADAAPAEEASPPQTEAAVEETPSDTETEEEPLAPVYDEEPSTSVSETGEIVVPELPLAPERSPFDKGTIRVGLGLGVASYSTDDWMILGLGVGYFVLKGLEPHLDTTFWVIGQPFMATLTPGVRYVLHFVPKVKPYVGGFYRHYFVGDDNLDTNSIGARLGLNIMTGKMSYFGAGVVYEHFLDQNFFVDQDQFYPEISFSFSF